MKWPFVRRSKYNHLIKCLDAKNDIIANLDALKNEYAQLNYDYMIEISRIEHDLANELNSHRDTNKKANSFVKYWQERCLRTEKELEETKNALKITQEENEKINIVLDKWLFAIKICVEQINKTKSEYLKK